MKRYRSFLEQLDDINSQISGIRDAIKKLQYQNQTDEIDMRYADKQDEKYNEKMNAFRERMKGRVESIKKLQAQINDIKKEAPKKPNVKPLKKIE